MSVEEKIIIALDTSDFDRMRELVDLFGDRNVKFKIGKELFTAFPDKSLDYLKERGKDIFLDLKFHDIPNTVAKACRAAVGKGVFMFNVHSLGGFEMMKAALCEAEDEAVKLGIKRPFVIAVTILTSMSEEILKRDLKVEISLNDYVLHLCDMAKRAGLDGVVASAREVRIIKENIGEDFLVVTPGIRPEWAQSSDQKRVVTPKDAVDMGVDYMVIGRPVTASDNPCLAFERICDEIQRS